MEWWSSTGLVESEDEEARSDFSNWNSTPESHESFAWKKVSNPNLDTGCRWCETVQIHFQVTLMRPFEKLSGRSLEGVWGDTIDIAAMQLDCGYHSSVGERSLYSSLSIYKTSARMVARPGIKSVVSNNE